MVTSTPTPENVATAAYRAALATAMAVTTGTATPTPVNMVTATPWPILIRLDEAWALIAMPTPTPTPTLWAIPKMLVGKIAFLSDRSGKTLPFVMDPDGSNVAFLTDWGPWDAANAKEPFSADGRYQAFVEKEWGDKKKHREQIFYYDFLYKTECQVTQMGTGIAWEPVWSPTSDCIAFVSNDSGNDEIWVVNRDGTDARQLTRNDWEWDKHPTWSPDGTQIAFWSNRDGHAQIYVMNADGTEQRNVSANEYNDWNPVWIK